MKNVIGFLGHKVKRMNLTPDQVIKEMSRSPVFVTTQETGLETVDYAALQHIALTHTISMAMTVMQTMQPEGSEIYVTFATHFPDVVLSDKLKAAHPEVITVMICKGSYSDLEVTSRAFTVRLRFGDQHEEISVPFRAVTAFVDKGADVAVLIRGREDDEYVKAANEPEV
jgi:hypothetical protein